MMEKNYYRVAKFTVFKVLIVAGRSNNVGHSALLPAEILLAGGGGGCYCLPHTSCSKCAKAKLDCFLKIFP